MGKLHEKAAEYHEQFAARIIKALEAGTAPWQKPWKPGERILPHNFQSGRDYRGGNALYLALNALERGFADPRWGGYRQIQEAGGHVRKGEKGTPIMYVDFRQRRTARDEAGKPRAGTRRGGRSSNGSSGTGRSSSSTTSSTLSRPKACNCARWPRPGPSGRGTSGPRR